MIANTQHIRHPPAVAQPHYHAVYICRVIDQHRITLSPNPIGTLICVGAPPNSGFSLTEVLIYKQPLDYFGSTILANPQWYYFTSVTMVAAFWSAPL